MANAGQDASNSSIGRASSSSTRASASTESLRDSSKRSAAMTVAWSRTEALVASMLLLILRTGYVLQRITPNRKFLVLRR